jgi:hypothetical protein
MNILIPQSQAQHLGVKTIVLAIPIDSHFELMKKRAQKQYYSITFFKGGPADPPLLQEKEHPTASKIHATLDSCPL